MLNFFFFNVYIYCGFFFFSFFFLSLLVYDKNIKKLIWRVQYSAVLVFVWAVCLYTIYVVLLFICLLQFFFSLFLFFFFEANCFTSLKKKGCCAYVLLYAGITCRLWCTSKDRDDAGRLNVALWSSTPGWRRKPRPAYVAFVRCRAAHGIGKQVKGRVVFGRPGTRSMSALPYRAYTRPRVVLTLIKSCKHARGRQNNSRIRKKKKKRKRSLKK